MAEISFEAGRLLWRHIRDAVGEAKFRGRDAEIWEGSGWLSRRFVVRGDEALIRSIERWLERLRREDEAARLLGKQP